MASQKKLDNFDKNFLGPKISLTKPTQMTPSPIEFHLQ